MKLTEKENLLLRRALDPASSPNEAEVAMAAFARSLRKRGVSGYDFVPPQRQATAPGPQARPSDAPPPQPPPPPKPEPPPQKAYEQAYKQATEPEPTRWETPPEPQSRFNRFVGKCLQRFAGVTLILFIGLISRGCPSDGSHLASGEHLATRVNSEPPVATYPTQADKDNFEQALKDAGRQADILRAARAQAEKDANWQRILDMRAATVDGSATPTPTPDSNPRGSRTNPYRIDWQKSSCFKLWEAVPEGRYYIDSHGQLIQKAPNPTRPGLSHPGDHQPII